MTTTQHVDEQTLIALAMDRHESNSHIDQCDECRHDLELWNRVADVARVSVASVPSPGVDLAERILINLGGGPADAQGSPRLPRRAASWRPTRGTRWLVAAALVTVVVAVVAITLSIGSAAPSDAMVLAKIRTTPGLIASAAKTVNATQYSTVREQDGFVVINYRVHGVFSPQTNAFQYTTTTQYPGQVSTSWTILSDGSLVYLPCNAEFRLLGKNPCIAYPAQSGVGSDRLAVSFLREAQGPVTRLGERTIGSTETVGYGLTIPSSAYVATAVPSERSLLDQELSTTKSMRIEVWSDSQGLPRELDTTYTYRQASPAALLTVTSHERLRYSDSPPRLDVPTKPSVLLAPNVNAAQQLLNTYDNEVGACFREGTPICGSSGQGG
jgi:hypothetical protein